MKVGVMTVLYHERSRSSRRSTGSPRSASAPSSWPRATTSATRTPIPPPLLADAGALKRFRAGARRARRWRSPRSHSTATRCTRTPPIADAHHATLAPDARARPGLEVDDVVGFSGCPGDGPDARAAELGHVPVAAGLHRDPRVAVERARPAVLARRGRARARRPACGSRFEMHPGMIVYNPETFFRLRDAVGSAVVLQLRPEPPVLAGHRRRRGGARRSAAPARSRTSTPRTPRSTRATSLATACSTPSPTATCWTARGRSAPSATATARTSGGGC